MGPSHGLPIEALDLSDETSPFDFGKLYLSIPLKLDSLYEVAMTVFSTWAWLSDLQDCCPDQRDVQQMLYPTVSILWSRPTGKLTDTFTQKQGAC